VPQAQVLWGVQRPFSAGRGAGVPGAAAHTGRRIIDAFVEFTRDRWFDELTLNEVAQRAGVSVRDRVCDLALAYALALLSTMLSMFPLPRVPPFGPGLTPPSTDAERHESRVARQR
jgi:hypothetical protein